MRLILLLSLLNVFFGACSKQELPEIPPKNDVSKTDFIYLDGKNFKIRDSIFQPVMLNYVVDFRDLDNSFVFCPYLKYENPNIYEYSTKDSVLRQLQGHFKIIREMGFNTVRICFDRMNTDSIGSFSYSADNKDYYLKNDAEKILNGLQEMLDCAAKADLRVMLLIGFPLDQKEQEPFTIKMLNRFKDNPTLFAYDFMNEPLYFDPSPQRDKEDAIKIGYHWLWLMRKHAPNQLYTIGFSEPIEAFEWDANLIPVDFVSFHTYQPMRMASEIYWYQKYLNKPWMIGETGLPADNDSMSFQEQAQFLWETMKIVKNAGGSGFAWWQFQDIPVDIFEPSYLGLMTSEGFTTTKDGSFTMQGTIKPAAKLIPQYFDLKPTPIERPFSYRNMMGYKNIVIRGKVVNAATGKPISGAVVRGWNEWWDVGLNTYTDDDGNFVLYSNDECVHFSVSALGFSVKSFDKHCVYRDLKGDVVKLDTAYLPEQKLEYHQINFHHYLKNNNIPENLVDHCLFDIDSSLFNQYKYQGAMQEITLTPLSIHAIWNKKQRQE